MTNCIVNRHRVPISWRSWRRSEKPRSVERGLAKTRDHRVKFSRSERTPLFFDWRTHRVFSFRDHRAIRRHFRVEHFVVSPFGWQVVFVEDGCRRAFWDAGLTIDTFVRVNEEHCFTLVEAFDWTDRHAVGVFAVKAGLGDYVRHLKLTFLKKCKNQVLRGFRSGSHQPDT